LIAYLGELLIALEVVGFISFGALAFLEASDT